MKIWTTPSGRCIFCEFRAYSRFLSDRRQTRFLHSTFSQRALHDVEPKTVWRFHTPREHKARTSSHQGRRSQEPIFKRPRYREKPSLDAGEESNRQERNLEVLVNLALAKLRSKLKQAKAEDGSDISQYTTLDPDASKWPRFKTEIRSLVRRKIGTGLFEGRGLESIMHRLNAAGNSWEIERVLHFAFADYCLAGQNPGDSNVLSYTVDLRYPTEWYVDARAVQREIHLHVGPTNSGKTYQALKRLEESGNGFYAGPLRLLAHEVYSRFKSKGKPCDLVTGDDVRKDLDEHVQLTSSTVEMVNVRRPCEVAVIDEIQMIANSERGWAWTRAFLGANAKEVHLCGEPRVVPLIRELAASMGDSLHVHRYERLSPLKPASKSLRGNLKNLRKGDCVVSFTIMGIHALKKQIELETGRRVAIVYGSLPPETRARQAELFNDPDNDYDFLVASNAIGMGLNL